MSYYPETVGPLLPGPDYDEIEAAFLDYIYFTRNCHTLSIYENKNSGEMGFSSNEYMNRWAAGYKSRYLKKLHQLQDWYNADPGPVSFVTFTTKHKKTDFIPDQVEILKNAFVKIKDLIRKRKGKFDYIGNMDFHKSGHAHYHYVLFVELDDSDIDYIKKMWSEKYGVGSYEKGIHFDHVPAERIDFVVAYIFRHSVKVFDTKFRYPGALRFHSCIRYMYLSEKYKGVRYINCSRNVSSVMKLEKDSEYQTLMSYHSFNGQKGGRIYTHPDYVDYKGPTGKVKKINDYLDYLISC